MREINTVGCLPDACSTPLFPFSRSSFKSACSLSLLADQQPENFCFTQHCLKCPRSNSLLPTALWDTSVSPLDPSRNFFSSLEPCNSYWCVLFPLLLPKGFFPTLPQDPCALYNINLNYPSITSHSILPSRHDPRECSGGDHQKYGYQCCTGWNPCRTRKRTSSDSVSN